MSTNVLRNLLLGLLATTLLACGGKGGSGGGGADGRPWEARRTAFLSHIFFSNERQAPNLQRRRAEQALDLVRRGTPFAEVAKAQSEEFVSRETGGFVGPWFPGREGMEALDGAVQVLAEGELAGPVQTRGGWHVLLRHGYEEGRRLERETFMPVWGLSISWRELRDGSDRSQEEAKALAEKVLGELRAGTLTLAEARERYAPNINARADGWLGMMARTAATRPLFELLRAAPPETYVGPLLADQGYALAKRGPFLRSIVRHILVQYAGAPGAELGITRLEHEAKARAEQALLEAQRDLAGWDGLVQRFSDELATRDDMGSLGCVGPQELQPDLEAAVLATKPGSVCPRVVRTSLGFHVIYRVD